MRNRWFHRPLLHSPALGLEKKVTWLELFYDLIFVAAFIQLGNGLSNHTNLAGVATFFAMFLPLWVAWTGFSFYENRFTVDDFVHRGLVFLQMFAVGGMAMSASRVLEHDTQFFSLAAGTAQLLVAVMHLRAYAQMQEAQDYIRYWGTVFFVVGALWIASAFLPANLAIGVWTLASVTVLLSTLSRQSRTLAERYPIDLKHLTERYGLLTIIVLGESFVKVLSMLVAQGSGPQVYLEAGIALLITCGIWWVYFDDIAGAHIRPGHAQWIVWIYAHIPLQVAIIAVGVAVKKAVDFSWNEPAPEAYRWLLTGSLALAYISVAAIDSVTQRRQAELSDRARVNVRWISGVVLLVWAPAGRTLSGGLFLLVVTAITFAQVIFDMMMAPLEEHQHTERSAKGIAEIAKEQLLAPNRRKAPLQDVSKAIRKGTPSELRRDLYFYFIEGSWARVFVSVGLVFLVANVFFAGLYTLEPESIASAKGNFGDAFFFSVQTMSTIGYGALSPQTPYGNTIVTLEAGFSIIGVAVVTGLIFAKVSRPRAAVIFSKPLLLTTLNGQRTLMFRAGNARGNEVVDAHMSFSVMLEEISKEGHHMRRLHELELTRKHSPMFVLSWLVMHVVDENSPLYGLNTPPPKGGGFACD